MRNKSQQRGQSPLVTPQSHLGTFRGVWAVARGRMDTQEKLSRADLLFLRSGIPSPARSAALWDLLQCPTAVPRRCHHLGGFKEEKCTLSLLTQSSFIVPDFPKGHILEGLQCTALPEAAAAAPK